jgi:hypothetical protein
MVFSERGPLSQLALLCSAIIIASSHHRRYGLVYGMVSMAVSRLARSIINWTLHDGLERRVDQLKTYAKSLTPRIKIILLDVRFL